MCACVCTVRCSYLQAKKTRLACFSNKLLPIIVPPLPRAILSHLWREDGKEKERERRKEREGKREREREK